MSAGLTRLGRALERARGGGGIGIGPYITAGDGGLDRTRATLEAFEAAGATCVELGVPFSGPVADGPVLQAAATRSLERGTTLEGVLGCVAAFRRDGSALPIALFSYLNPLLRFGLERAVERMAEAGADGVLVPDLPLEECEALAERARGAGLAMPLFAAPTTSTGRLARVAAAATGFLYVVGRAGVTGAATDVGEALRGRLAELRAVAGDLPLAVGFGLESGAQVAALRGAADLAISGTAVVRAMASAGADSDDGLAIRRALDVLDDLQRGSAAPTSPVTDHAH